MSRIKIVRMKEEHREAVAGMIKVFFESPAVATNGSREIADRSIDECIGHSPYAEGYVFLSDGEVVGYSMLAKSFSTEYGKRCIWIEDLYIREEYRNMGIGRRMLDLVMKKYPDCCHRLEVETENAHALHVYEKAGFSMMPYDEMIRNEKL